MTGSIKRRLAKRDPETHEWRLIDEAEIVGITRTIVILGDPGLGKSVLTEAIGREPGHTYVRAGTFVRSEHPETFLTPGGRVVIDGLDEVASTAIGGGVEAVLAKLSKIGNPPFILSSREADWRGGDRPHQDRRRLWRQGHAVASPALRPRRRAGVSRAEFPDRRWRSGARPSVGTRP